MIGRKICLWVIFLAIAVLPGAVCALRADVITPELEARLGQARPGELIPVVVTLSERLDFSKFPGPPGRLQRSNLVRGLKSMAEQSQAPLRGFLRGEPVGRRADLWLINGMALEIRPAAIRRLANRTWVSRIQLDYRVRLSELELAPAAGVEWNLEVIRAPQLWELGYTGRGVVVASMDSGVDVNHPDLAGGYRGGTNSWYDPYGEHLEPYDADGHGTQVMGVIVGGSAGGTAVGVAPDAEWIAVKIFRDSGTADLSRIHQGFQWLLDPDGDPDTDDAPDIVNNSWLLQGTEDSCNLEFEADIEALRAANIAVVFSGGNSGFYGPSSMSPANNPGVLAVGAVDEFDNVAYFSSRGPSACGGGLYPQLSAPGASIRTPDLTFGLPAAFFIDVSGTSFAAPHVAGAMALLKSAYNDLSVKELENALTKGAFDLGSAGPDYDSGYGRLDILKSYRRIAALSCGCDLNRDGVCNLGDWLIFTQDWGRTDCGDPGVVCECDRNRDGRCNNKDRILFIKDWGRTNCRAATVAIPVQ
jgi:serine protease AprX